MVRLPQGCLSAGKGRYKVVMYPHQGSEVASGHPSSQEPLLGRVPPLDTFGQWQGPLPASVWIRHSRREANRGHQLHTARHPGIMPKPHTNSGLVERVKTGISGI